MTLLYSEYSYKILGACFEVYKEKGCGFVEPVYQEYLEIELAMQGIPFRATEELSLQYKGRPLQQKFKPDFVCFGLIVVEIKAVTQLLEKHRAQVHNYLKATGLKLGLLVNFASYPQVEYERIVR